MAGAVSILLHTLYMLALLSDTTSMAALLPMGPYPDPYTQVDPSTQAQQQTKWLVRIQALDEHKNWDETTAILNTKRKALFLADIGRGESQPEIKCAFLQRSTGKPSINGCTIFLQCVNGQGGRSRMACAYNRHRELYGCTPGYNFDGRPLCAIMPHSRYRKLKSLIGTDTSVADALECAGVFGDRPDPYQPVHDSQERHTIYIQALIKGESKNFKSGITFDGTNQRLTYNFDDKNVVSDSEPPILPSAWLVRGDTNAASKDSKNCRVQVLTENFETGIFSEFSCAVTSHQGSQYLIGCVAGPPIGTLDECIMTDMGSLAPPGDVTSGTSQPLAAAM